jgi:hypothetical protein
MGITQTGPDDIGLWWVTMNTGMNLLFLPLSIVPSVHLKWEISRIGE